MKVRKLIELLNNFDPEATVYLHDHKEHGSESPLFVLARMCKPDSDDKCVWLETKTDMDYPYQLGCRFDDYFESEDHTENELLEFYTDLLDRGVTVDEVREYVNSKAADDMELFCKSHELL